MNDIFIVYVDKEILDSLLIRQYAKILKNWGHQVKLALFVLLKSTNDVWEKMLVNAFSFLNELLRLLYVI